MVWRVSGGNTSLIIAGSFHLLQAGDYPLPESYEVAWRESAHVVMEIPPGEAQRPETVAGIKLLTHLKSGSLAEHVAPATWKGLTEWADATSYPVKALEPLAPWMAALTVAVATGDQLGYKGEHGIERHFTARLANSGKTTEGLETILGQLEVFHQIDPVQQEAMLSRALTEARTLGEKAALLTTTWRTGDTDALHASLTESFRDFPELKRILLDDRNAAWIPRLEALLQGDRPTLVLVGAGHLCGPGNVIELLEAKGYRCLQVKIEAQVECPKAA